MVLAVSTSPKMVAPVMVTVPVKVAMSVVIVVDELAGDAKWVAVSTLRATKLCAMLGVKPVKVVEACHVAPASILYWQSAMVLRVMLVAVFDNNVGAAGAVCVAFVTVAVGAEVTSPVQLAAVTVTVMVAPMSAWASV